MSFNKNLPPGLFARVQGLPVGTTEIDLQQTILKRTGVELSLDRISVTTEFRHSWIAMLSFEREHVLALLNWAMSDDEVNGVPLLFEPPRPPRETR